MSRSRQSDVNFNVNIKGVKDAEQLSKILQKLKKQFEDLEGATVKVNENLSKLSSGSSGGSSRTKPGDIGQRLAKIELGVKKGDIESVQQLNANYGSLVNQIKALERQGIKTDKTQLQAFKTIQRLRKEVERNAAAEAQNAQSKQKLENATTQVGEATQRSSQAIAQSNQVLKQSNQQVNASLGDLERQGAFLSQNIGFFIQDAPFGIRGVANNISGISNAFELMKRRIREVNATTGQNITMWQVLKKTLTGPLGISLIIGSILPTVLLFATEGFRSWTGSIKDSEEALGDAISKAQEFVDLQSEFRDNFGDDPLGISKLTADLRRFDRLELGVATFEALSRSVKTAEARIAGVGTTITGSFNTLRAPIKTTREDVEQANIAFEKSREIFGDLIDIEAEALRKKIEEINAELTLSQGLFKLLSPDQKALSQLEQSAEIVLRRLTLAQDQLADPETLAKSVSETEGFLLMLDELFKEAIERGNDAFAIGIQDLRERLRGELDEEDGKEKTKEEESTFEDRFDIRKQFQKDALELELFRAERELELTSSTNEKIERLQEIKKQREELLQRDQFESFAEFEKARLALVQEIDDEIRELRSNALTTNIELENMALERRIANPNDLDTALGNIRSFYDNREAIIRESIQDEEELKLALAKNDAERIDKQEEAEKQFQDRKRELQSTVAEAAITNIQAVAQFATSNSRAQFLIQRTAAAATAVINARQAFTKTLAGGGFLAKPLAFATLALGLGQAAAIASQSFSSASSTGRVGGGFSGLTSFRGFDPTQEGTTTRTAFGGSSGFSANQSAQANQFPDTVKAEFTDGFGKVVSNGTIQLQRQQKTDLGFWQG